jgi:SAM-dependent methyltransferase
MRQDERAPFVTALHRARRDAYPPGQYVGQESFMTADEIRVLAQRAGIGSATSVLDLCCGTAGPGRLIVAERGCDYLGLDYSASALDLARELAGDVPCRFAQVHLPPIPTGTHDVVLLLETMLAFADKHTLLRDVSRALRPGGVFACTVEVGPPLTATERGLIPDADTVHLCGLPQLIGLLADMGLSVTWTQRRTRAHHVIATALLDSFRAHAAEIVRHIGRRALDDLLLAHQLWSDWLGAGRVEKYILVAHKQRAVPFAA